MNDEDRPRDARLAATSVLPAIDPTPPAYDDFAATTLDRPAFHFDALAGSAHPPPAAIASPSAPPSRPRDPPRAKPESDAMLWIVLALLVASALGIACALAIGLAATMADETAETSEQPPEP